MNTPGGARSALTSAVATVLLSALSPLATAARSDSTATGQDSLISPVFECSTTPLEATASEKIHPVRLAVVTGALAGTIAAIHVYQMNGWWKENRRSFHFREDLKYGLNVDKLGHFYGGTAATYIFRKSFRWANLTETAALWWGAGASTLFLTYVEIEDGFSTWGFDRVDFATNVGGAFYPVAQHYLPALRDFNMKFSYHPSPLLNEAGGVGFRGQKHIMFDDYEGQTIWFSARVHNLLPESVRSFWPKWLCLALGYGVRDVGTTNPYRVYFLALDLDMTEVFPKDSPFLQTVGETLNFFHLPLPAVRISPNVAWFGVYF